MSTTVHRIVTSAVGVCLFAGLALLGGTASAQQNQQYPMLDTISQNVINKYKATTCKELAQRRQNPPPPTPMEKRAAELLGADPKLRAEFFSRVGGTILDKMFECGLIF